MIQNIRIMHKISVITVCFNSKKTIVDTFESILNQTLKGGFEYIVIDGASTDGTLEIINSYKLKFKEKGIDFTLVSEKDRGIYDAMNKGIKLACGNYIGLLNSDDFYELNTLDSIRTAAYSNPDVDIFYGFLRVLMDDGEELQVFRYMYENYLGKIGSGCESGAQHPTCFVKKSLYERIGYFDLQYTTAADYDFLLRAKLMNAKFKSLDMILSNFRNNGVSNTISNFEKIEQRYNTHFNHGLISSKEYNEFLKYKRLKGYYKIKSMIGSFIFGKIK
jgi:glycosyltransferase involved in cell wall biosynthesis